MFKVLQRCLQIAFGIDEERCRGDDFVAFHYALQYCDVALASTAQLHRARLEAPVPFSDEHNLARATVDHCARGNGRDRFGRGLRTKDDVRIHARSDVAASLFSSIRTGIVRVSSFRISG